MSYRRTDISCLIESADSIQNVEDIYDFWTTLWESVKDENPLFSDWKYATDNGYVSVRDKGAILAYKKTDALQQSHNYTGLGPVSFMAHGNYKPSEFKQYACTQDFTWNGDRKGSFSIETTYLKDVDMADYWKIFANCFKQLVSVAPVRFASASPDEAMDFRVFPHRRWVGWMAFVPGVDLSQEMPFVAVAEYIQNFGTLIVTTTDPFDPENPEHVKLQRATEVFLAERDLLPVSSWLME